MIFFFIPLTIFNLNHSIFAGQNIRNMINPDLIPEALRNFASDNLATFRPDQIPQFLLALILSAFLSFILSQIYVRYGNSLSNRKAFAKNFVILATTTMFIITIVKSSLALSLGLVGALSIVRFRSAIKEPEELAYLFLNIAIGLGCGAGHTILTIIAFFPMMGFILINNKLKKADTGHSLYLLISTNQTQKVSLNQIIGILAKNSNTLKLKRTDESNGHLEASFFVDFSDYSNFENIRNELHVLDNEINVTFMDTTRDY